MVVVVAVVATFPEVVERIEHRLVRVHTLREPQRVGPHLRRRPDGRPGPAPEVQHPPHYRPASSSFSSSSGSFFFSRPWR